MQPLHNVVLAVTTKVCCTCRESFPLDNFVKDKNRKDGLYPQCRDCRNAKARKYRADYPNKSRAWSRKYKYGITEEEYNLKLKNQMNRCFICYSQNPGGNKESFFVDHDHTTGQVRGLLCRSCNLMIGHANDSIYLLQRAIDYLEYWRLPSQH